MRALICGAALVLASVSVVFADDTAQSPAPPADATTSTTTTTTTTTTTIGDPMAGAYGNTIIVTGSGPESHTHYNADHTFNGVAPAFNYQYQGTWELTPDGKVCRTFTPEPPGITNPDCDAAPLAAHVVGDTWTDEKGGNLTLVAGIQ